MRSFRPPPQRMLTAAVRHFGVAHRSHLQRSNTPIRVPSFFKIRFNILLPAITNGLSPSRLRTHILLKHFISSCKVWFVSLQLLITQSPTTLCVMRSNVLSCFKGHSVIPPEPLILFLFHLHIIVFMSTLSI